MKILFAGSAPFSLPVLEYLIREKKVSGVLTAPDRPAGRGLKTTATPVKVLAETHNIPIFQPEKLRGTFIDDMAREHFDVLICSAYGKIFGPKFLSLFKRGAVNIHPSLLPRFRGAAPIPAAILAGDEVTGISLQKISVKMDCGDILLQSQYKIKSNDTSHTMAYALSNESVALIDILLSDFDAIYTNATAQQEEKAVYCQKITPTLGVVQWWESASDITKMVRAFSPPYSGVKIQDKENIIKIWAASVVSDTGREGAVGSVLGIDKDRGILIQCKKGVLGASILQNPGKKKLHWKDFIRGYTGSFLGGHI